MEKEVEEENKPKKHKFVLTNPDWLFLPEPIATNIILERLEIVDYIRFSAVCKKWQSIQKEHRIGYSPSPPPLPLSFPWLRCVDHEYNHDGNNSVLFHHPDKQKSYKFPFPKKLKLYRMDNWHGFLILFMFESDACYKVVYLFNPITAVLIMLPQCSNFHYFPTLLSAGRISSPPTDPDCTILLEDNSGKFYFYRLNDDSNWKKIDPFRSKDSRSVFCNNKIYILNLDGCFYMIDTLLPDPVKQMTKMDCSEINAAGLQFRQYDLVNFFGEVVLVTIVYEDSVGHYDYDTIKEFHVYKPDFLTNSWMRMETLDDGALFYCSDGIFALSAIDVGCKKNTIYSAGGLKGRGVAWRAFDISTRDWIDGPPLCLPSNEGYLDSSWSWFLPTL